MSDHRNVEDSRFLQGRGRYTANLAHDDVCHLVFARSTVAHAVIGNIYASAAEQAPGVIAVFTASNLGLETQPPELPGLNAGMVRDLLARTHVRFVGEPYAAIVARSAAEAADAIEFVEITYEPLPVVVDIDDALSDQVLLHPAAGTNTALEMGAGDAFDHDEIRVEATIRHSIVAPTPLEGRSALARPSDGKLTMWVSGQGPHPYRDRIAGVLGMARDDVRVVCPDVGGGFGGKAIPHPEELIVAQVARLLGVPILWVDTRTESMLSLGPSRGQQQHIVLSGRRDGTITGVEMDITQDSGAYPRLGAYMTNMARLMLPGPYQIPRVHLRARSVVTNTNPHLAFRGAGQPEYASAVEHVVDKYARRLGLDPLEVRRRNLIRTDSFPYSSPTGVVYDSGDYERALDLLSAHVDYRGLREQQATRRQDGLRALGIGVATFVESCSTSNQAEWGRVVVNHDATVDAWTGTSPHGQGHETTWATLIERELGVSTADIRVHFGDTDHFESGTVTGGSRSVQTGGIALTHSAIEVREQARRVAADLLEAKIDDVVYNRDNTRFHVQGTPARFIELAVAAQQGSNGCIEAALRYEPTGNTISFGAYVAVVEVDTETGKVDLQRFVAVDDCGTVINHTIVEGQVHGGVAQGIGQALFEEIVYDRDGNLLTTNFADYTIPSAAELPDIEALLVETPSPRNVLGAKGVGESGPIGALPAVLNAIVDALTPLGVTFVDMPATPERVWRAIQSAKAPPSPPQPR